MSGSVQCLLCPHTCRLEEGQRGTCRVRMNLDGELVSLVYGRPVAAHVDPVEKKPVYHYLPGTKTFSIATAGCNLGCEFCQNWEISQAAPEDVPPYRMEPGEVVSRAEETGCSSVAYTYTEPIVFYEYVEDTARLAREAGMGNIMVTAGYINEGPLRELAPLIDAVNVDLKSIRDDYYRTVCHGTVGPVLNTLEVLREMGVWLEVTNLVVPGLNDSEEDLEELCSWIADNLGPDVPLHFSRFFPTYRMTDRPPTPLQTLERAGEIASGAGLRYVYVGNVVTSRGDDTFCPECGRAVVRRDRFRIVENGIEDRRCAECGREIPGVWQ
ncbi:MAG: AmmeMemoRadiSam system radical SAM enzyme [Candidatus Fermentibacteraceae bacterium]